ncbi:MAG TPA: hypothetical protein VMF90_00420 [Rhizobiaceae bacterium]|nr:hypothetical protein [Rhizobiaceae bacterium]
MAWQAPPSGNATINVAAFNNLFVPPDTEIVTPNPQFAVDADGSNHIIVYGRLFSGASFTMRVNAFDINFATGNIVEIATSGRVQHGFSGSAIVMIGFGGEISNAGSITSNNDGILLSYNFGTKSTKVINSGTINVEDEAVRSTGVNIVLTNSGTIKGDTVVSGGSGADSLSNSGTMTGDISLWGGNDIYNGAAGRLSGQISGGAGNDRLTGGGLGETFLGGADVDTLTGNGGADTLKGDAGNDTLNGGVGLDRLWGGANSDIFVFNVAVTAVNRDTIYDFNLGNDRLHLDNAVFTKIGATGPLKAAAFKLSTQVKDADDRIIYNKTTGALLYDSDGSGAAAPIHFATLQNKPVVTAADFTVI